MSHSQAYLRLRRQVYRARHKTIRVVGSFILAFILLVFLTQQVLAPALATLTPSLAQVRWTSLTLAALSVCGVLVNLLARLVRMIRAIYLRGLEEFGLRQRAAAAASRVP